jgi:glyoxylase-like metal-dependent hydrolase (beta-lactamase superfamily II)
LDTVGNTYSWTVGDVVITSIVETDEPTSPRFLFHDLTRDGALRIADDAPWLRPHFIDDQGFMRLRVQCLIIDTGSLRIAVDTCVGNDKQRSYAGWHEQHRPFLEDMTAAGYPPESIDFVICTHLHVDHVGWNTRLVGGQWVPTFANARYIFTRPEVEHWVAERETRVDPNGDLFGDSVAPILDAGLADLVPTDHVICDTVRLDPTPGHTPGHVSVVIESAGQQAVITGDMIHTPLQIAQIALSSQFDTDPVRASATRVAFLTRYQDDTIVIGTHWGGPGSGRIRIDDAGHFSVEV